MIKVLINGRLESFDKSLKLSKLLTLQGYKKGLFVVAKNREFISLNDYEKTKVEDGDEIEILEPMSGG